MAKKRCDDGGCDGLGGGELNKYSVYMRKHKSYGFTIKFKTNGYTDVEIITANIYVRNCEKARRNGKKLPRFPILLHRNGDICVLTKYRK